MMLLPPPLKYMIVMIDEIVIMMALVDYATVDICTDGLFLPLPPTDYQIKGDDKFQFYHDLSQSFHFYLVED